MCVANSSTSRPTRLRPSPPRCWRGSASSTTSSATFEARAHKRVRQRASTAPILETMKAWLEAKLSGVSGKSTIAEAIRYTLSRWQGLVRFREDGRIEIDSNVVERAMRPIALGRKNHLFAGSDEGGRHWAVLASLIETAKMNDVDPQAYLADVLVKIVNRHPMSRIDELLPWAYVKAADERQVA